MYGMRKLCMNLAIWVPFFQKLPLTYICTPSIYILLLDKQMVTFPECLEQLFQDCLDRINSEIAEIGLSTIEVVVHEKRNSDQDGYNKVVIVTNQLADGVKGRVGDGIVTYPFLWNDAVSGPRTLGVDGKWNCQNMTPDECCNSIKQSMYHKYLSCTDCFLCLSKN